MPQSDQFLSDLHAPADWVRQVEGKTAASARWQDGSYGNDAAPSWILVDDAGVVHAQAFYYTSANAERFETRFSGEPYVAVSIIRDGEITESCTLTPAAFLGTLATFTQTSLMATPGDALMTALREAAMTRWDRTTG